MSEVKDELKAGIMRGHVPSVAVGIKLALKRCDEMEALLRRAAEALEFYARDDERSVECEVLESVDLRPATRVLADIRKVLGE